MLKQWDFKEITVNLHELSTLNTNHLHIAAWFWIPKMQYTMCLTHSFNSRFPAFLRVAVADTVTSIVYWNLLHEWSSRSNRHLHIKILGLNSHMYFIQVLCFLLVDTFLQQPILCFLKLPFIEICPSGSMIVVLLMYNTSLLWQILQSSLKIVSSCSYSVTLVFQLPVVQ